MKIYDIHQQHIYSGEIWQKSDCLGREELINQQIFDCLTELNFSPTDHCRFWTQGDRQVIVCLVDDILSCSIDYHNDLPYTFGRNTTVITDNYLTCPTQYRVLRVPESFFGIYHYSPDTTVWQPDRDFSFMINRIDYRRFKLLLDLAWRTQLELGYVNFNCLKRIGKGVLEESASTFREQWEQVPEQEKEKFARTYQRLEPVMPFKNYTVDFEQATLNSWVNIVVESYSSDNNISLSEKIFRALVTPAPWTVYSGRYTVAYLESLGFDCMSDIIDHNHYDRLKEVENKLQIFNWKSLEIVKYLKQQGVDAVRQRCVQAAQNNCRLLDIMKQRWPTEFTSWIDNLSNQLN